MQRKSFVALAFTHQKLQVIKLNSGKSRIDKFGIADLPKGLVSDYQVVNPQGLAVVIKSMWRQLHLREKSVGLVAPEFSSFVKPLELPKIEITELDEAVRWQAQEFLPSATSDMVMDWKLIKETPDKFHVLTLAMKKNILAGYVDAVAQAGLFPLLVETPAISLNRLTGKEPSGKLIVYSNLGETIYVIAQGEQILGSSIINIEEKIDLVETASLIVRHYKEVKVGKVYVGGGDMTQTFAGQLGKSIGQPVEIIKTKIQGLPPEQVQKYLVPISLSFEKSVGPSDESTINLLPQKWVKKYENKRLKVQIWTLLLISTFLILSCLLVIGGTYFYLISQAKVFAEENALKSSVIPKELTSQIDKINSTSSKILTIMEVTKTAQEVMNKINDAKPADITISEYKIDLDTGKVTFNGLALTRESLVKFKTALEDNKDFSLVRIPISSFEAETNLEFEVSFVYLPASKKVGPVPRATPKPDI